MYLVTVNTRTHWD